MLKFNFCGLGYIIFAVLLSSFVVIGCLPGGIRGDTKGEGEPVITEGEGEAVIIEGEGEPVITEGEGEAVIIEGEGEPVITEGEGEAEVTEGEGEPVIVEGEGEPATTEGEGEDVIIEGEGEPVIVEGEGEPVVTEGEGEGDDLYFQDSDIIRSDEYPPFTKKHLVYGITLVGNDHISDCFMLNIAEMITEILPQGGLIDAGLQRALIADMLEDQVVIPVVTPDFRDTWTREERDQWDFLTDNYGIYDIIYQETPGAGQVNEVVEHIFHHVSNGGLQYTFPGEWGISETSDVYFAMQEAIEKGHYDISQYNENNLRVTIQEFAYWVIFTGWDLYADYGPDAEWTGINNPTDLENKLPLAWQLFEGTIPKVMAAPSSTTIAPFMNPFAGGIVITDVVPGIGSMEGGGKVGILGDFGLIETVEAAEDLYVVKFGDVVADFIVHDAIGSVATSGSLYVTAPPQAFTEDTVVDISVSERLCPDNSATLVDAYRYSEIWPDYDSIFDNSRVKSYFLTITANDWERLKDEPFEYVPGTFRFEDEIISNVGIRHKGNVSFSFGDEKLPFKVKFNEYVAGQKFYGIKKINLHNGFKDPTVMRENLAYALHADAGNVASRTSHVRLYLTVPGLYDDEYIGLYICNEAVTRDYAMAHFGNNDGVVYKGGNFRWYGDDPSIYVPEIYEPKSNEDSTDHSELVHFLDVLNNTPLDQFKDAIEEVFDVPRFLGWLAANTLLADMDGIPGGGGNCRMYYDTASSKFVLLPWDMNESFGSTSEGLSIPELLNLSIYHPVVYTGASPLIERILDVPEFVEDYEILMRSLIDNEFSVEAMTTKIDEYYNRIKEHVYEDTKRDYSIQQFEDSFESDVPGLPRTLYPSDNEVIGLKRFVRERVASVDEQLGDG